MLNFEYNERSNDSTAEYSGLTIRAVQDESPFNPFEDGDETPLLWYNGDGGGEYGNGDLTAPLRAFSDYQLGHKRLELCKALDVDPSALEVEIRQAQRDYGGKLVDHRREALEQILDDMAPGSSRSWPVDYVEALADIWSLAGCDVLSFQRSGYCQGDSVLGLLVATPEWRKRVGAPAGDMDLEPQADVFGAWAFGECYGYVIEDSEGEHLDSCWGYYGANFDKNGLEEAAVATADYILSDAAKRRMAKLKDLIRARVPVAYRSALLAEASKLESA